MTLPVIEVYSDIHCPWAYLATYRLRQVWPAYQGRLRIVWRALALEYRNDHGTPKRILDAETGLMPRIEPGLPITPWTRPDYEWPVTFWPAFEALACAREQDDEAAWAMSWALRHAFFADGRSLSLRHELFAVAHEVAATASLDYGRFERDWDGGRYKESVLIESRRGWYELNVPNSPTFVLPDGRQISNPAAGVMDLDGQGGVVRSYTPYDGDPLAAYRSFLDEALRA